MKKNKIRLIREAMSKDHPLLFEEAVRRYKSKKQQERYAA